MPSSRTPTDRERRMIDDRHEGFEPLGVVLARTLDNIRRTMDRKHGAAEKILAGLQEAADTARLAAEVAVIIQDARNEGVAGTRTAYRVLGCLGLCVYHENGVGQ